MTSFFLPTSSVPGPLDWAFFTLGLTVAAMTYLTLTLAIARTRGSILTRYNFATPDSSSPFMPGPMAPGSFDPLNTPRPGVPPARPVQIFLFDVVNETKPFRAWVTDVSADGVRISTDDRKVEGTFLSIRPLTPETSPGWVQVVVHQRHHGYQGWQLDCRFVKQPGRLTLAAFQGAA